MTTAKDNAPAKTYARRRPLAPAARQAAARAVMAANKANGKPSDPRIVAIAKGGVAKKER